MKKALMFILGAAILFAGCTKELEQKVSDLETRVANIEAQVDANQKAIAELQKADFITSVQPTEAGWSVTLLSGKVLALYNGKNGADGAPGAAGANGKDGDAFFQSVTVEGDQAVFTLTDGTTFTVPFIVEFGIELLTNGIAVKPSAETRIPFRMTGKTTATEIHVIGNNGFDAYADMASEEIVINSPAAVVPAKILVIADRGDGKTAAKTINIEDEVLNIEGSDYSTTAFWGETKNFAVTSNVEVTFSTDVPWISLKATKAPTEYVVSAKMEPTPSSNPRSGNVFFKDGDGIVVKQIKLTQGGTKKFFLNNSTAYDTWADAMAVLKEGKEINAEGTVQVVVSEGNLAEYLVLADTINSNIKKFIVEKRLIGVPTASSEKTVVDGLIIKNVDVELKNICIAATGSYVSPTTSYPVGIDFADGENHTVTFTDGFIKAPAVTNETILVSSHDFKGSNVTFTNVGIDAGTNRFGQLYGNSNFVFDNCTIANSYASYAIRPYETVNLTVKNSLVNTPILANIRSTGNFAYDNNTYSSIVTAIATYQNADPIKPGENTGKVLLNGVGMPTIQAAIDHAAAGAVIELPEGEYAEALAVAFGKDVTIQAAAGADRDKVIIAGSLEVSGNLIMKGVTLKTKDGVTTSTYQCKRDGDGYAWGHYFLARVELGADKVTFDNVHFIATDAVDNFKNTLSMLWISNAANVVVKNCVFDSTKEGAYCVNQTHVANVQWTGNVFNGGGNNEWAIRAMDTDVMTIALNEFYVTEAVQIYKDFTGTLTFGDGAADNNFYGPGTAKAISCPMSKNDLLFTSDAKIYPKNLVFNAPSTTGAATHILSKVWDHMDDAGWLSDDYDFANCRNFVANEAGIYAVNTNGFVNVFDLDGNFVKKVESGLEKVGTFVFDGATTLDDGTIIISNLVTAAGNVFTAHEFDGANFKQVVNMTNVIKDGATPRLGDYVTAWGTKSNYWIVTLDKPGSNRTYMWNIKDGANVGTDYVAYNNGGLGSFDGDLSFAAAQYYKDGKYIIVKQTGSAAVMNATGWTGQVLAKDMNLHTEGVNKLRTPKFFSVAGEDFMALTWLGPASDGSSSKGAIVYVYALPNKDLVADLSDAEPIATYEFPSDTPNANACGGLDVVQKDGKTYLVVGLRSTGMAMLEFK